MWHGGAAASTVLAPSKEVLGMDLLPWLGLKLLVLHVFLFRYSHFFQLYKDMYVEFTGASKLTAGVNGCIISSVIDLC